MKLFRNIYFLVILSVILLLFVFKFGDYLTSEQYIKLVEKFQNNNIQESSKTSHTVNLPLTTNYTCNNFCGPTSRCAISGQQCFADIDCPGCQPKTITEKSTTGCVKGNDDAGKLTVGVTPSYSPLTSGYGTKEKIIENEMRAPQANFGIDAWGNSFNQGQKLFDKRYKPNNLKYMPNYPNMYSITGEFIGDGPLPSNY